MHGVEPAHSCEEIRDFSRPKGRTIAASRYSLDHPIMNHFTGASLRTR